LGKQDEAAKYQNSSSIGGLRRRICLRRRQNQGRHADRLRLALAFDLLPQAQREQAAQRLVDNISSRQWHLRPGCGHQGLMATLNAIGRTDVAYHCSQ
jgi:hypothetical protein